MIRRTHPKTQSGVVLIVGLVFLMLLTLIGVAAIQNSTMQERMAGNAGDRNAVFQSAENALQTGEDEIIDTDCSTLAGMLDPLPDPNDLGNWTGSTSVDSTFQSEYTLSMIPPKLEGDESEVAEETDTCGGFYYVTAKAESGRGMTIVLQSTVFKRY